MHIYFISLFFLNVHLTSTTNNITDVYITSPSFFVEICVYLCILIRIIGITFTTNSLNYTVIYFKLSKYYYTDYLYEDIQKNCFMWNTWDYELIEHVYNLCSPPKFSQSSLYSPTHWVSPLQIINISRSMQSFSCYVLVYFSQ